MAQQVQPSQGRDAGPKAQDTGPSPSAEVKKDPSRRVSHKSKSKVVSKGK